MLQHKRKEKILNQLDCIKSSSQQTAFSNSNQTTNESFRGSSGATMLHKIYVGATSLHLMGFIKHRSE